MDRISDDSCKPFADGAPGGPDLAYDPQRQLIEQAFEASVSIDASGIADAERDIDWRTIIAAIREQAQRTRDIWLPVYLCRAGARSGALEIVAEGAQLLAGLLEQCWAVMHPAIEDYGFESRRGACDTLVSRGEMLMPLEQAAVFAHPRLGRFAIADLMRFHKEGEAAEGHGQFRLAIAGVEPDAWLAIVEALDAIGDGIRRADAVLVAEAGGGTGTNFRALTDLVAGARAAIVALLPGLHAEDETIAADAGEGAEAPDNAPRATGAIRGRDDVLRHLDLISRYYREHEPSSPVPLLLDRARGWVTLDFVSILQDLAPGSVEDATRILRGRGE
ncbi:type VI secretion system protein ImpA [Sphingomonas zeicaulis]|uniref:type VI secretion system protein TssA n=1 Tax=Sphingomonas zeicaulis TaxID=1632740 RepID=UPI003D25831E